MSTVNDLIDSVTQLTDCVAKLAGCWKETASRVLPDSYFQIADRLDEVSLEVSDIKAKLPMHDIEDDEDY